MIVWINKLKNYEYSLNFLIDYNFKKCVECDCIWFLSSCKVILINEELIFFFMKYKNLLMCLYFIYLIDKIIFVYIVSIIINVFINVKVLSRVF